MSNNVIHRFVMSISSSRHGGCLAGAMGDHQNSSADSPRALMVYFVMQKSQLASINLYALSGVVVDNNTAKNCDFLQLRTPGFKPNLVKDAGERTRTDLTPGRYSSPPSPPLYVQIFVQACDLESNSEISIRVVQRTSEARAENVEQGHSGVDQRSEHLLAAAVNVGDAALQVLVPLERRLPRFLLRLHARLGPELHGGRLVLLAAAAAAVLLLGGPPLGARHPAHEVGHLPYTVAAAGPRRVRRAGESRGGGGDPARSGGDLDDAGGSGGVGERGEAGEDGRGAGRHGDGGVGERGRERRSVRGEALGERRGRLGGHGAHGGREAREVARRAPLRATRGRQPWPVAAAAAAAAQRGARLGLERGERDERLAEAAVRVGEAEEVVEEALREARRAAQAAQRLLRLRVVQQVRERDEDTAHLRRRRGHGRRRGRAAGRGG